MKKIRTARKSYEFSDFLHLNFFAERFRLPVSCLCWGIIFSGKDGNEKLMPAVLIKGKNLFINLYSDALTSLCNIAGSRQCAKEAVLIEEGNIVLFKAGSSEVQLDTECFYSLYRTKIYSDQLAEEADRLN